MIITKFHKFLEYLSNNFNIDIFKNLNSFSKRISYCDENIERISSGSSRIVYKINDEKVLKLAKNTKGLEQNKNEIQYRSDSYINYILAKIYDYDEGGVWIEMEYAQKMKITDFKRIVGIDFKIYTQALSNFYFHVLNNEVYIGKYNIDPDIEEKIWNNEFISGVFDLLGNYNLTIDDLNRTSTYGIVEREGQETIVIIDYGLSEEIYNKYYNIKRK